MKELDPQYPSPSLYDDQKEISQGKSSAICQPWKKHLPRRSVILCCLSGEPFTQEEMEDMLSTALDPETNTVRYRDYISMLIVDET